MIYALAPMDWITDSPYRQIVKKVFDKYNNDKANQLYLFTEFISSEWFYHNYDGVKDHFNYDEKEWDVICQIFWSNEEKLLYMLKSVNKNFSFSWIELNIWCPSPSIMRLWAGSALLYDKEKTLQIVKKLSENSTKPFSIKTRSWLNNDDKEAQKDFIIKASKYCNIISIHSRTMKQSHSWESDVDYVLDVKRKANSNCKIIFNWGINKEKLLDIEFMKKMKKLDGIMIWQAAIWNPWIFVDYEPSWIEKKSIMLEHLSLNIGQKWEFKWIIEFRKFIWNYIKWIKNASKYRLELMQAKDKKTFEDIVSKI